MAWLTSLFSASTAFNPIVSFIRVACITVLIAGAWYIDHLRGEVAVLQANQQVLVSANQQDSLALKQCNDATVALQEKSKELQAKVDKAEQEGIAKAQVHENRAKRILDQSKAKPSSNAPSDQLKQIDELFNSLIPEKK